ncbi:group I truncated hemoglobin [Shewanella cyperi]|uniref:group I truncated hemoglobin n=1 Tax=Shewanella cyperi TaxID=2814292 RepID=UPI001A942F1B|nr:group 1 truncated hemoglobin [Shewanella cyperi]QSX42153.1 group 1 truncated hemoglobin [Shewanella cyperi]
MIKSKFFLWAWLAVSMAVFPVMAEGDNAEPATPSPSLYDRLGGLMPISVVVNDFLDVLVVDDELNRNPAIDAARKRVPVAYLKYRVTSMVCQVTGGDCEYRGRAMRETHQHLNITENEWDRMIALFKQVLAKHQVPEQETAELLDIMASTKADIVISKS